MSQTPSSATGAASSPDGTPETEITMAADTRPDTLPEPGAPTPDITSSLPAEFAPAKINLALHVVGQRADGYHLLDSLVAFADIGDWLHVAPNLNPEASHSIEVTGPKAPDVPTDNRNLALRAAEMMGVTAHITLDKHLPAAAGIGGGSADAAAVMRVLARDHGARMPVDPETLGADIPVCLLSRAARLQGIGERVAPIPNFPPLHAVLVNPGIPMSTPTVFKALHDSGPEAARNTRLPSMPKEWKSADDVITWLLATRNDLAAPAIRIVPTIGKMLNAIGLTDGCRFAQLSGSGATCFGLYTTRSKAELAAQALAENAEWWVCPVTLGSADIVLG